MPNFDDSLNESEEYKESRTLQQNKTQKHKFTLDNFICLCHAQLAKKELNFKESTSICAEDLYLISKELGASKDCLKKHFTKKQFQGLIQALEQESIRLQELKANYREKFGSVLSSLWGPLTGIFGMLTPIIQSGWALPALTLIGTLSNLTGAIFTIAAGLYSVHTLRIAAENTITETARQHLRLFILHKANSLKDKQIQELKSRLTQDLNLYNEISNSIDNPIFSTDPHYTMLLKKLEKYNKKLHKLNDTEPSQEYIKQNSKSSLLENLLPKEGPEPFTFRNWLKQWETKKQILKQVALLGFGAAGGSLLALYAFSALFGAAAFVPPVLLSLVILTTGVMLLSAIYQIYRNGKRKHELNYTENIEIPKQKIIRFNLARNHKKMEKIEGKINSTLNKLNEIRESSANAAEETDAAIAKAVPSETSTADAEIKVLNTPAMFIALQTDVTEKDKQLSEQAAKISSLAGQLATLAKGCSPSGNTQSSDVSKKSNYRQLKRTQSDSVIGTDSKHTFFRSPKFHRKDSDFCVDQNKKLIKRGEIAKRDQARPN